jgi:hypothetical protein
MASGYTDCACRGCFDIAISSDMRVPELCGDCENAGCDRSGDSECCRDDAYGYGEQTDDERRADMLGPSVPSEYYRRR